MVTQTRNGETATVCGLGWIVERFAADGSVHRRAATRRGLVPGRFLLRCSDGRGGGHPFDVDDQCYVLAVDWKAGRLYDVVEAQHFGEGSARTIPVPDGRVFALHTEGRMRAKLESSKLA